MSCLFCDIIKNKNERTTVYEDDKIVIIMDKFPICDGHLLVIPKSHYETIFDIPDEELSHMFVMAKKYAKIVMKALNEGGCTFSINYGSKQEIKHLHLHIMPDFDKKPSKTNDEVYKLIMEGVYEKEKEN